MQPPRRAGNQPATALAEKMKGGLPRAINALLAAAWILALAVQVRAPDLAGRTGWLEAALLLLATAGTIAALARQLPLQNVLLAAGAIALMGGAAHALGARLGIPFGPFLFGAEAGPQLFKLLPWSLPLIWVVVILNCRGVARLILRPWRKRKVRSYGFWLIGVTALLVMLFTLAFDPFATRAQHCWLWLPTKFPLTWLGAPLVNFFSWAAVAVLMLAFVTPALINKNPVRRPPDYHPLAVWVGAVSGFGIVSAQHGLWPAAVLDGVMAALAAALAIRGGRW
jgi:uncharacterized membrane protein